MKKHILLFIFILGLTMGYPSPCKAKDHNIFFNDKKKPSRKKIDLPAPKTEGSTSLEKVLQNRRSVREYRNKPLALKDISQLLWAAQGITDRQTGKRTAPSAGALYPLEIYLTVQNCKNLSPGIYHYLPREHEIELTSKRTVNKRLAQGALGQMFIARAAINLIITADYSVTTSKYTKKGITYLHMEAGHAAQNVYLQAESLNLGTVSVGAFEEEKIKNTLNLPQGLTPLYIMPVGKPR